jgi:endonuclease/exonuclease/phosphatase family metal-dependent hydrolase
MLKSKFLFVFILLLNFTNFAQNINYRMMTYNIRYANNNPGEEWDLRKDNVAEMIRFHNPDIFGVQEALIEQIEFLYSAFENYELVGVGRDDGHIQGEFSALFISSKFKVKQSSTFWLSETPDTHSFGWDAACKRIATWAIIADKNTHDSLFVINTHLDHMGEIARKESVILLMKKIKELSNGLPVLLSGDFNFNSKFEGYKYIEDYGLLSDSELHSQYLYGTDISFNGFQNNLDGRDKIDYIFVSKKVNVIHHAVIGDQFNKRYPSDHMPVIIDFSIN